MSQIALVQPTPLDPLPTSRQGYVPILLDKPGERRALSQVSTDVWLHMTPMIVVARYGSHPTRGSLRDRVRAIAESVASHPIYLDLAREIAPCKPLSTPNGKRRTLEVLYDAAQRRGLSFMPVAGTADRECRLAIVRDVAAEQGLGLALRHRLGVSVSASGTELVKKLDRVLTTVDADAQHVDLILELEYLAPDQQPSAKWLGQEVNRLSASFKWRSIVLAATSVPKVVGEICGTDSAGERDRAEWTLWQNVCARTSFPVAYGDYGIQNPAPPSQGWRGFANVRYTTRGCLVVSRGHDITDMTEYDVAAMCRRVTDSQGFEGSAFSWGDQVVAERAAGRVSATAIDDDWEDDSDLERHHYFWRAVGTSHHLKLVSTQLAEASRGG
jgi:hypothetical protein